MENNKMSKNSIEEYLKISLNLNEEERKEIDKVSDQDVRITILDEQLEKREEEKIENEKKEYKKKINLEFYKISLFYLIVPVISTYLINNVNIDWVKSFGVLKLSIAMYLVIAIIIIIKTLFVKYKINQKF